MSSSHTNGRQQKEKSPYESLYNYDKKDLFRANDPKVVKGDLPFSLKDIRQAIPAKYFEADIQQSVYYLAKDFAQLAGAYWVASFVLCTLLPEANALTQGTVLSTLLTVVRSALWCLYWGVQGTTCFGIWVIGHECGHQAYFGPKRKTVNDTVGFILHSVMLAPYHAWRISHATHHHYTNNIEKDTAFPPRRYPGNLWKILEWCPPLAWPHLFGYLVMGWPFYLAFGLEGNWFEGTLIASHFDPSAPLFTPKDRNDIIASNIGLGGVVAAIYFAAQTYGWSSVLCWYLMPLVVNYAWLVTITFLQHTDRRVPHYLDKDWNFVKGALCTVDRHYGIFDAWMHHITNGHVLHHLFHTMPFYHAIKVTPLVEPLLGEYYLTDRRPLLVQLWESWFAHQASFLTNPFYLQAEEEKKKKAN